MSKINKYFKGRCVNILKFLVEKVFDGNILHLTTEAVENVIENVFL